MVQDSALVDRIVPSRRAAQAAMARCKEQQQPSRAPRHNGTHFTTVPSLGSYTASTSIPTFGNWNASEDISEHGATGSRSPTVPAKATKSGPRTVRRSKSAQDIQIREPSQTTKLSRFISPKSDTSTETQPRPTKRKGTRTNGIQSRKRAKLEVTVSETRIQDLIRPSEGNRFITKSAHTWSLDKLDEFVYVRLGSDGSVAPATDSYDQPPGYWWPAKVFKINNDNISLSLKLYGDDGSGGERVVVANQPSHHCINSWKEVNSVASFIQGSLDGAIEPRLLKNQFRSAREAMQADIGLQKLVSPVALDSSSQNQSPINGRGRSLTLTLASQLTKIKTDDSRDLDPDPDPSLQIPGELVLAREPKAKHIIYWPARILGFSPKDPNNDKDFPGYVVQIFPEPELPQKLRRSFFCTTIEDEFLTCKAGEWQTEFADNHIPRDEDAVSRTPTPEAELHTDPGLAPPQKDFRNLDINEQVKFIQPILSLIVEGRYIPSVPDHIAFLQGGESRAKVAQMAGQDGGFSTGEIGNIRYEVMRWALRGERRSQQLLVDTEEDIFIENGLDTENKANDDHTEEVDGSSERTIVLVNHRRQHPPRPKGDGLYEKLSQDERIQYCTDFLCRQALIQLIMWREGLRTTVHQRAPDDELQAYNTAADKLAEGHWWEDVKNRRKELLDKKREREYSIPLDLDRRARRRR